ncbi:MAG TPA: extracellular solute-binding protein [Bacteroidota bacterium]|nr:extracellular solute-binding protein [Bacteroidota bacterium]
MNIKQIWGLSLFSAMVLFCVILFYIYPNRQPPKEIEIYFADRFTEAHRMLIDRYNAQHKGSIKVVPIDFTMSEYSTDARKEILARSLRGEDDAIDLLAVDLIWVHRFAKWCEPLGQYFSVAERERFTDPALRTCYHEGELVAVPFYLVQGVMYYRQDLLERLPHGKLLLNELSHGIPWTKLLSYQKQLHWKGPYYIFPAADYEGMVCSYIELLLSLRPNYFETVGFRFDTPEAKQALQFLVDLVHRFHATPPEVSDFTETPSYEYFLKHDGLFLRGWTSYEKDYFYNPPVDTSKQYHLKKAPLPFLDGGKSTSLFGGWNLMVSKASTKKEAVIDFVKYLLSDDAQEVLYKTGGFYPVINSFYTDSSCLRRYPEIPKLKELINSGVHRPLHENYTKYSKIMARYFSLAIKGGMSVDEALRRAQVSIESEKNVVSGM